MKKLISFSFIVLLSATALMNGNTEKNIEVADRLPDPWAMKYEVADRLPDPWAMKYEVADRLPDPWAKSIFKA